MTPSYSTLFAATPKRSSLLKLALLCLLVTAAVVIWLA
jgi:hypothetical protein